MGWVDGDGFGHACAKCGGDAIAAPHRVVQRSVACLPSEAAGAEAASLATIAPDPHSAGPLFFSPDGIPGLQQSSSWPRRIAGAGQAALAMVAQTRHPAFSGIAVTRISRRKTLGIKQQNLCG